MDETSQTLPARSDYVDKILVGKPPTYRSSNDKFDCYQPGRGAALAHRAATLLAARDEVSNEHCHLSREIADRFGPSRLALRAPHYVRHGLDSANRSAQRLTCGRRAAPTAVTVDPSRTVAEHGVEW